MKKLYTLSLLALILISCNNYAPSTIDGTVINTAEDGTITTDTTYNGKMAYLTDYNGNKRIDSCAVVDGEFTLTYDSDSTSVVRVDLERLYTNIISDEGAMSLNLERSDLPSKTEGSELNSEFYAYYLVREQLYENNNKVTNANRDSVKLALKDESDDIINAEIIEQSKQIRAQYNKQVKSLMSEYFYKHKEDNLGTMMLWDLVRRANDLAEIDYMMNMASDKTKRFSKIVIIRENLANVQKTSEGKMFVDFDCVLPDGVTAAKFSDIVGKGKYVLVDFWASWCTPCIAEVPNLRAIHEKYKEKGLVVLGMNVWERKQELFEKALEDHDMPWTHLRSLNEDAIEKYGICGVPHIILFGPDGTILARGIRGEGIDAKIAEYIK